jgi:hypothetical protein
MDGRCCCNIHYLPPHSQVCQAASKLSADATVVTPQILVHNTSQLMDNYTHVHIIKPLTKKKKNPITTHSYFHVPMGSFKTHIMDLQVGQHNEQEMQV